jgi:hypothetical protein
MHEEVSTMLGLHPEIPPEELLMQLSSCMMERIKS